MNWIPLHYPGLGYLEIEDVRKELGNLLHHGKFESGRNVELFEDTFAREFGFDYAITCASHTTALATCLVALGIWKAHVVVPSLAFPAVPNAVMMGKNYLHFCDIENTKQLVSYHISPRTLRDLFSQVPSIECVIATHMFGYPIFTKSLYQQMEEYAETDELDQIPSFIEDGSHSIGAKTNGEFIGCDKKLGDSQFTVFSLSPRSPIHCGGEGGIICTNNEELATICRIFINDGTGEKLLLGTNQLFWGMNWNFDEIRAVIALKHLEEWNKRQQKRKIIVKRYIKQLCGLIVGSYKDAKIHLPYHGTQKKPNWNFFTIRTTQRAKLQEWLLFRGIEATPIIYRPLYQHQAYITPDKLDNVGNVVAEMLHIPCHHQLTTENIDHVVNSIKEFFEQDTTHKKEA